MEQEIPLLLINAKEDVKNPIDATFAQHELEVWIAITGFRQKDAGQELGPLQLKEGVYQAQQIDQLALVLPPCQYATCGEVRAGLCQASQRPLPHQEIGRPPAKGSRLDFIMSSELGMCKTPSCGRGLGKQGRIPGTLRGLSSGRRIPG